MRRTIGISRNKYEFFQTCKNEVSRKKNIFRYIGKDQDLSQNENQHNSNNLLSVTTKNSAHSIEYIENSLTMDIYDEAKNHLHQVSQYRKKMTAEIKLRMASFKESDIKAFDQNISKYSSKAVDHLVKGQKILSNIKRMNGCNDTQQKFYRNMQKSLALQIREVSRSLRAQQKEYYDRLRMYQTGTLNMAIQLRQEDKQKMKDQFDDMQVCQTQISQNVERNKQITQLVKSINQLSTIYKQLNELVIEQGSLIDRIDFNIQQTFIHVNNGVEHLEKADQNASNPCAQKCMMILIILIILMAVVMGFKLSK